MSQIFHSDQTTKKPADPKVGPCMQKIVSLLNDLDHEHQNMCLDFNIRRMRP